MELFKDTGHFVDKKEDLPGIDLPKYYNWREFRFNPRRIIGLAVHSLISGRPRANYYTDSKQIFNERDKTPQRPFINYQKEDMIREDLVFQILDGRPHEMDGIYRLVDGHLRISDFNSSFMGLISGNYTSYLEEISKEVPAELIKKDEHNHINRRILRSRDNIERLLSAMKADEFPLPKFAATVEKNLRKYGY